MAPHARTITVALDMSKAFDTINIHTLIRKLLQTNIRGIIIKFITSYIKGRKAYTTYRKHTSRQHQLVAAFNPHYLTYTPQTDHHPVHRFRSWPTQTTSPSHPAHTSTSAANKNIQPYLHKVFAWTKQNNLILIPEKNNLHSIHAGPCRIYEQSRPSNKQQSPTHGKRTQRFWVFP